MTSVSHSRFRRRSSSEQITVRTAKSVRTAGLAFDPAGQVAQPGLLLGAIEDVAE